MSTLGQRLTELLAASGLTLGGVSRRIDMALGVYAPSKQTIGQYHNNKVTPERADLILLSALATVYGAEMASLHPVIAERWALAREVVVRSRCAAVIAA